MKSAVTHLLVLVLATPLVQAATVVESFDYTPGLLTATATGTGLTGSWSSVSGGVDIVSGSLSAAAITGYGFATTGNRVSTRADGFAEARVGLGVGNTIDFGTDSTTYFSYLFKVNDTDSQFRLRFLDSSNVQVASVGDANLNDFLTVQVGSSVQGTSTFTAGSTFLVAGKIETTTAGNDTISASLFTDVTGGEPVTWNAISTGTSSAVANQLSLYTAADTTAGKFEFDELRLGDTFAAVTVPEPSSFALLALGLGLMFAFHRPGHRRGRDPGTSESDLRRAL